MKKENKLIIGEILLYVEKKHLEEVLVHLDISDKAYLEAKQEFNSIDINVDTPTIMWTPCRHDNIDMMEDGFCYCQDCGKEFKEIKEEV